MLSSVLRCPLGHMDCAGDSTGGRPETAAATVLAESDEEAVVAHAKLMLRVLLFGHYTPVCSPSCFLLQSSFP